MWAAEGQRYSGEQETNVHRAPGGALYALRAHHGSPRSAAARGRCRCLLGLEPKRAATGRQQAGRLQDLQCVAAVRLVLALHRHTSMHRGCEWAHTAPIQP